MPGCLSGYILHGNDFKLFPVIPLPLSLSWRWRLDQKLDLSALHLSHGKGLMTSQPGLGLDGVGIDLYSHGSSLVEKRSLETVSAAMELWAGSMHLAAAVSCAEPS